ncbi:alpha/beta fold hydrolase [Actinoplanes sp. DH11]|uniref:alpha/beta fold hydrolase n=1 Tax=Actinoplanes sp. DH11 TaxID=2857011 RepID=UPI001E4E0B34|nr:alpha/beta fold hydrolase [Actinoplanes sp. DH11]
MPLAHDVTGSGPAVLLLHSTVCDRRMWDPQIPALTAAGYRVVRCDLRGYGESPVPAEPWDDTTDVTDLLADLAIDRTAVIGSSGGGQVAIEFAARTPDRVTALVLLCTALPGHEPSAQLREFGAREDALLEAGDVAGATELNVNLWLGPEAGDEERSGVREMQRNAFDIQLAADREQAAAAATPPQPVPEAPAPDVTASASTAQVSIAQAPAGIGFDIAAITAPTLLVSGAHDLPDFQEIAAHLAGSLPHARHLHLPWAGHLPSLERPDLINPLLIEFLTDPA